MNNIKVALHNLGCKVNSYELDVIRRRIPERGWEIVDFHSLADIYIINTCTVTNIADRKSRQMIHRAKALNPSALVVALGCYVDRDKPLDPEIDLAVGNNDKGDFFSILDDFLASHPFISGDSGTLGDDISSGTFNGFPADVKGGSILAGSDIGVPLSDGEGGSAVPIDGNGQHTRAFLKIQDGCNQFCTYCIIPHVRGRIKSRPGDRVLAEAKALAEQGYKEIVLTGIHISSYGKDLFEPPKDSVFCYDVLLGLIKGIADIKGIERIRLGSLEPRIITPGFVKGLADIRELCPHFHLSLQSGCDEVLKRMNRHYTAGEYGDKMELLREYFHNPAITTDIIVGFPGESDENFNETLEFVDRVKLSQVHIFKYSRRDGTPAASYKDQLTEAQKGRRASLLKEVTDRCHEEFLSAHKGEKLSVLFEEAAFVNGRRYMKGHSREYIDVMVETGEDWTNTIREVVY